MRREIQKKILGTQIKKVADAQKAKFKKDFAKLQERADEIQVIRFIQDQERKRLDREEGFTSKHYEAAWKILKFWRKSKARALKSAQELEKNKPKELGKNKFGAFTFQLEELQQDD